MDAGRPRKVEALYEAALEVEASRRAAFLVENCGRSKQSARRHQMHS